MGTSDYQEDPTYFRKRRWRIRLLVGAILLIPSMLVAWLVWSFR